VCVYLCLCSILYVCLCREGEEENKRDEVAQKIMKDRENEKIKEEKKYKSSGSPLSSDNDTISAIKKILIGWNNRHHGRPLKIAKVATQPTCLAWTTHTSSGLVVWVINNPNGQTFSLITFLLSHYFPSHTYFLRRSPFILHSLSFSFYTDKCLYTFFLFSMTNI